MHQTASRSNPYTKFSMETLSVSEREKKSVQQFHANGLSQRTQKVDASNISCRKLGGEAVVIKSETKSFTPLALSIEKHHRKQFEHDITRSQSNEITHYINSSAQFIPTGGLNQREESNREELVYISKTKANGPQRPLLNSKISHKKGKSVDITSGPSKGGKHFQANMLSGKSSHSTVSLTGNFLRPLNTLQDHDRKVRNASEYNSLRNSRNSSSNKMKSQERNGNPFVEEKGSTRPSINKKLLSPSVERMVKENAKKLIQEQKKRSEEFTKRKTENSSKRNFSEENEKVLEQNKQFYQAALQQKKRLVRESHQGAADQGKYITPPTRKTVTEGVSQKKEKYYRLDERERRERMGLGQIDDIKMEYLRNRSKEKQRKILDSTKQLPHGKNQKSKSPPKGEVQKTQSKVGKSRPYNSVSGSRNDVTDSGRPSSRTHSKNKQSTASLKGSMYLADGIKTEEFDDKKKNLDGTKYSHTTEDNYENFYCEFKNIINGIQHQSDEDQFYNPLKYQKGCGAENSAQKFQSQSVMEQRKQELIDQLLRLSQRYENVIQESKMLKEPLNPAKSVSDIAAKEQKTTEAAQSLESLGKDNHEKFAEKRTSHHRSPDDSDEVESFDISKDSDAKRQLEINSKRNLLDNQTQEKRLGLRSGLQINNFIDEENEDQPKSKNHFDKIEEKDKSTSLSKEEKNVENSVENLEWQEVIEGAAVFIQKCVRGYLTRKLISRRNLSPERSDNGDYMGYRADVEGEERPHNGQAVEVSLEKTQNNESKCSSERNDSAAPNHQKETAQIRPVIGFNVNVLDNKIDHQQPAVWNKQHIGEEIGNHHNHSEEPKSENQEKTCGESVFPQEEAVSVEIVEEKDLSKDENNVKLNDLHLQLEERSLHESKLLNPHNSRESTPNQSHNNSQTLALHSTNMNKEEVAEKNKDIEEIKEEKSTPPKEMEGSQLHNLHDNQNTTNAINGKQNSEDLTSLYQNQEEATRWNQIISQISLLEGLDESLSPEAKALITNLRNQLEENKKTLQTNFTLEKVAVTSNLNLSNPRDSNGDNQPRATSPNKLLEADQKIQADSPSDSKDENKAHLSKSKKQLVIDTDTINQEQNPDEKLEPALLSNQSEGQNFNLDIIQMRLAMGSEKILRKNSGKSSSLHSLSTPKMNDLPQSNQGSEETEQEFLEQDASGLFSRNPFKEFTKKKYKELLQRDNMEKLIKMREQALDVRHQTQVEYMNKMLETKRFSPNTFNSKKIELEKWVTKEREQIRKSKKEIEKGWMSFFDAIKKTERDLQFMKKIGDLGKPSSFNDLSFRNFFTDEENETSGLRRRRLGSAESDDHSGSFSREGEILRSPSNNERSMKFKDRADKPGKQANNSPSSTVQVKSIGSGDDLSRKGKKSYQSFEEGYLNDLVIKEENTQESPENQTSQRLPAFVTVIEQRDDEKSEEKTLSPALLNDLEESAKQSTGLQINQQEPNEESDGGKTTLKDLIENQSEAFIPRNNVQSNDNEDGFRIKQLSPPESPKTNRHQSRTHKAGFGDLSSFGGTNQKSDDLEEDDHDASPKTRRNAGGASFGSFGDAYDTQGKKKSPFMQFSDPDEDNFAFMSLNKVTPPQDSNENENLIKLSPLSFGEPQSTGLSLGLSNDQEEAPKPLSLSCHIDLSQIEESKGYQPATQKAIERIMALQKKQEELERAKDQNKGFKCHKDAVNEYMDTLCKVIQDSYLEEFLSNINIPINQSPEQKLANLHVYDIAQEGGNSQQQPSVLSVDLYLHVEEHIKGRAYGKAEDMLELELFHNKAIFDAFNEALDTHRPYGLKGVPYLWKLSQPYNPQVIQEQDVQKILQKTKEKVLGWCGFACGFFGTSIEVPGQGMIALNEEQIVHVKEERLGKMLALEVVEAEDKWICYDDQETFMQLEMADVIFDLLASEAAENLYKIICERRSENNLALS